MGRKRIIVGAVAIVLVVVTGVALAVVVPRLRDSRAPAPPVASIAATLRVVTPAALVGQEAELLAGAVSRRPLARFELWSGGELVAEARPVTNGPRAAGVLRWAPPSAGNHLLVLRAIDDLGHAAHAAPVRMRTEALPEGALPPSNELVVRSLVGRPGWAAAPADSADPAAPAVTTVVEGCTLRISADAGSLPALALFTAAPGQPGFQSLRYGDTGHSEATLPLAAGDVAVYALGYAGQESAASPILSVAPPAECADSRWQGDVSIVDGLLRSQPGPPDLAYLYLSIDGGPWQRVPAQDQTFVRRRNGVLDFSRVLPSLGAAKRIDVEAWSHDGTSAYKVGSGTLTAGQGEENFMPVLVGVLPATDLDIVVTPFGDFGTTPQETLERYGEIHAYEEVNPPKSSNEPTSSITITPSGPTFKFPMRWKPKVFGITHGVWQVSVVPLGSAPLTAPGVLLSGTVPVTKLDFNLNFAPLVSPVDPAPALEEESAVAGPLKYADYSYGTEYSDIVPQGYEAAKANVMAPYVDAANPPAAPGSTVAVTPPEMSLYEFVQWLHPEYLYVRIIPMAGEQPVVDTISNTVTFRLYLEDPTPYVPPPPPTVDVHVEFQRPYLPDAQFEHCVRVVENKFATPSNPGANPPRFGHEAIKYKYKPAPVGATVCPEKPSSDDDFDLIEFLEDVVSAVAEFWDVAVAAFDYLKAQVVDLLVDLSGCGKVFPTNELPDHEEVCKVAAELAVDVVLIYFGLPTSLPNSHDLYAAAQGQLTDVLYELAAAEGFSCPQALEEECKEQLQKMLDEVMSEAKTEMSKAAKASAESVGVLWLNPEIVVVPEPRGRLQPAIFTTTFTRKESATDDAAVPETASHAYHLDGQRNDWHWYDYDNKQQIEHTTVYGTPLTSSGGATPPILLRQLAPGESTTVVKVLDRPAIWFEPGADPTVKIPNTNTLIQVHSDYSHWWVLMMGGARLTANAGPYGTIEVDSWITTQLGTQP